MADTQRDYLFRLRGDADQLVAAHERAAAAVDRHADQTAGLAHQQAIAQAEADRFIAGLKRQADAVGKTRAEVLQLQAAELGVADKAAPYIARLQAGEKAASGFARTNKLSAFELQQVGYQLNDLAVQVASGQNPLTALVQQGSQLSGTFGGVRPALSAVFSLLTPARLAVGGLAAGVGLLALAYLKAQDADDDFKRSLALTGNAAGVTRESMDGLARTVQQHADISIAASREITQALVSTGQVGPAAIGPVANAIGTLQRLTGESADSIVKDFASMSQGVARWAAEHNRQYNYLTAEQYKYIRSLEAQGRTEEAMAVNAKLLDDALKKRGEQLGYLERAWNGVKNGASAAWDAMLNVGRPQTVADQIDTVVAALAAAQEQLARGDRRAAPLVDALTTQLDQLQLKRAAEMDAAAQSAETARKSAEQIRAEQQDAQNAQLALTKAGFAERAAAQRVALEADRIALERSYEQAALSLRSYVQVRKQLGEEEIALKEAEIQQEIALEQRRQAAASSPVEVQQSQARIAELRARRQELQVERLQLEEEARKNFGVEQRAAPSSPRDALAAFKATDEANVEAGLKERRDAATKESHALLEAARDLNIALIVDDRARGEAMIAQEERELRKRLDLASMSADERQRVEADLADYIALRERQLTEQLKPEWQKRLELWEDVERRRKQVSDEVSEAFVDGGRQAFGDLLAEGKLSFDQLGKLALRTLGEQLYERSGLGRNFAALGDAVFNGIDSLVSAVLPGKAGGGIAVSASADATGLAEREALRQMENALRASTEQVVASTAVQELASAATEAGTAADTAQNLSTEATTGSMAVLAEAAYSAAAALAAVGGGKAGGTLGNLLGSVLGGDGGATGSDLSTFYDMGPVVASAKGNVFAATPDLAAYSNQIVTQPTLFRFARGARFGEMGEAGAEAVVPLVRSPSGHLGVRSSGAAAPNVNLQVDVINNYGPDVATRVEPRGDGGLRIVLSAVANDMRAGGVTARAATARLGMNNGAALSRRRG